VKLAIHLQLLLRPRRCGVVHPLFTGRQSRRREEKKMTYVKVDG